MLTTNQVADFLKCTPARILNALRQKRVTPPPKRGPFNAFLWEPDDVERVRAALNTDRRRRENRVKAS